MDRTDWLRLGDVAAARHAFNCRCFIDIVEDRIREMHQADYQVLIERIDEPMITIWLEQTRKERGLVPV